MDDNLTIRSAPSTAAPDGEVKELVFTTANAGNRFADFLFPPVVGAALGFVVVLLALYWNNQYPFDYPAKLWWGTIIGTALGFLMPRRSLDTLCVRSDTIIVSGPRRRIEIPVLDVHLIEGGPAKEETTPPVVLVTDDGSYVILVPWRKATQANEALRTVCRRAVCIWDTTDVLPPPDGFSSLSSAEIDRVISSIDRTARTSAAIAFVAVALTGIVFVGGFFFLPGGASGAGGTGRLLHLVLLLAVGTGGSIGMTRTWWRTRKKLVMMVEKLGR